MLPAILLVAAFAAIPTALDAASLKFRLRDVQTGYTLVGNVKYARVEDGWDNPTLATTDSDGWFRPQLTHGFYLVEVSVRGYRSMRSHMLASDNSLPGAFMMSPDQDSYEFSAERVEALLRPGYCLAQGFVLDAESLKPLLGVEVEITPPGLRTKTNQRGYYELFVPVADAEYPMISEVFRLRGYGTVSNRNMLVAAGDVCGGGAEMVTGGPPVEKDLTHQMLRRDPPSVRRSATPTPAFRRSKAMMTWLSGGQYAPDRDGK